MKNTETKNAGAFKKDEIIRVEELSKSFKSSGTIVNAIGGYPKSERQIVYFIVNHFQVNKLKAIVHEIDRGAFVSLQEVSEVIHQKER